MVNTSAGEGRGRGGVGWVAAGQQVSGMACCHRSGEQGSSMKRWAGSALPLRAGAGGGGQGEGVARGQRTSRSRDGTEDLGIQVARL